jgi:hypothetical protein
MDEPNATGIPYPRAGRGLREPVGIWAVSPETKAELIEKLTKTASEITKLPPPAFFCVCAGVPA